MFGRLRSVLASLAALRRPAPLAERYRYLARCRGVVHVGANTGQERDVYARLRLPVVWIEALPEVFRVLQANIAAHPGQVAICALLAERDGGTRTFHVASNNGESSSLFDFKHHREIWPGVTFTRDVVLESMTLDTALVSHGIDPAGYDALVLDTQGSELLVLQGAGDLLARCGYVATEAADFESYENCATVASLGDFLLARGFRLVRKDAFAEHPSLGGYYDLLFERTSGRQ